MKRQDGRREAASTGPWTRRLGEEARIAASTELPESGCPPTEVESVEAAAGPLWVGLAAKGKRVVHDQEVITRLPLLMACYVSPRCQSAGPPLMHVPSFGSLL